MPYPTALIDYESTHAKKTTTGKMILPPTMEIPEWFSAEATCLGEISPGITMLPLSKAAIKNALARPVWQKNKIANLADDILPGESVCLVVSDHTRKTAADQVLPPLLDILTNAGCSMDDLFILVASGIHRPSSDEEIRHIIGDPCYNALAGRIFTHNADDEANLVAVGRTARGHLVHINRHAVEADKLILIGSASYHYHAGFGGGRKSLVPGLAGRETIAHNHSLTLDSDEDCIRSSVAPGVLDGNPVAEEMLECARLCPPTFIVNTVLDPQQQLVGVFAGELDAAHRAACKLVEHVSRADLQQPADIVIASAGNAGDWIQTHKALFNAHRAIQSGGLVILIAPCPEGLGDARFRYWLTRESVTEVYAELRQSPEINGQTALSTRIRGADALLVTNLSDRDKRALGIETAASLSAALKTALNRFRQNSKRPTFYSMPAARHVTPWVNPNGAAATSQSEYHDG